MRGAVNDNHVICSPASSNRGNDCTPAAVVPTHASSLVPTGIFSRHAPSGGGASLAINLLQAMAKAGLCPLGGRIPARGRGPPVDAGCSTCPSWPSRSSAASGPVDVSKGGLLMCSVCVRGVTACRYWLWPLSWLDWNEVARRGAIWCCGRRRC